MAFTSRITRVQKKTNQKIKPAEIRGQIHKINAMKKVNSSQVQLSGCVITLSYLTCSLLLCFVDICGS